MTGWSGEQGRRCIEEPRAVGVQPQLRHHLPTELVGCELQLEHGDWAQHGEIVERHTVGRVPFVQRRLLFREQLAAHDLAVGRPSDEGIVDLALHRVGAHAATRHRVDFDAERGRHAQRLRHRFGIHRS
jgi:hypothetical protein